MTTCCNTATPENETSPAMPEIKVNGVVIDETLLAQELQYHQAASLNQAIQQAGQALVIRQLLLNELSADPIDEESEIAALVEKNSHASEPSENDCQRYFSQNQERFKTETLLEAEHILLAAAKDDIDGRDEAKTKGYSLIDQLNLSPESFAQLAEQYSICPSKKTGGSLGQIGKGQTVPEFEKQLTRLPEGLAKDPIESRYGFHVVRINRKIDGKPLEYQMVAEKIKHYLTQKASQLSIQAYIQSLVEKSEIIGLKVGFSDENIVL